MAELKTTPRSSTPAQRKRLVLAAKRRGICVDVLRGHVGGSISALSSARCSELIEQLTGDPLPNPPGKKPSAYKGRPADGVTRLITDDQCDQIMRLAREYFDGSEPAARAWLDKNFKVTDPRGLATSVRGADAIYTLKLMVNRKCAASERSIL